MADVGNKIRKYIQDIAGATVSDKERTAELAANISKASRAKDTQINSITAQIKLITNTVTLLSKSLANKENNSSGGNSGGGNGGGRNGGDGGGLGGRRIFHHTSDMGSYCLIPRTSPSGRKAQQQQLHQKKGRSQRQSHHHQLHGWQQLLAAGEQGKPSQTTPATKASQPPGDKSRGWILMNTNTR